MQFHAAKILETGWGRKKETSNSVAIVSEWHVHTLAVGVMEFASTGLVVSISHRIRRCHHGYPMGGRSY